MQNKLYRPSKFTVTVFFPLLLHIAEICLPLEKNRPEYNSNTGDCYCEKNTLSWEIILWPSSRTFVSFNWPHVPTHQN